MTAHLFLIHASGMKAPLGIAAVCTDIQFCTVLWRFGDGVTLPTTASSREWAAVERLLACLPDGAPVSRSSPLARTILGNVLGAVLLDVTRLTALDVCATIAPGEWVRLLAKQLQARIPDKEDPGSSYGISPTDAASASD